SANGTRSTAATSSSAPGGLGGETLLTPVRAPRANAIAEPLVGTLRRERLDYVIVVNEQHLRAVLSEFVCFYNLERPHWALVLETPTPLARARAGPIRSRPVLGGLHHVYERAARRPRMPTAAVDLPSAGHHNRRGGDRASGRRDGGSAHR